MERLSYNPKEFMYFLRSDDICKCDNNCQIIVISRDSKPIITAVRLYRALPVFGPLNNIIPCPWCNSQVLYRSRSVICPAIPEYNALHYVRCVDCQLIINRMYEYWENRHPLFKNLSSNDYLKTEIREPIIATKCEELRKKLYTVLLTMRKFLPKDPAMEILTFQLKLIQKEYRLSIEDFSL